MVHNVDTTIIDADSDHSDTTDVITNKDPVWVIESYAIGMPFLKHRFIVFG
jgi:hypothetical protein